MKTLTNRMNQNPFTMFSLSRGCRQAAVVIPAASINWTILGSLDVLVGTTMAGDIIMSKRDMGVLERAGAIIRVATEVSDRAREG